MNRDNPQDRLLDLRQYTELYCDGALSVEQTAEFERRLRDDPRAMDAFVLYMEVHSHIAWNARAHAEDMFDRQPANGDERRSSEDGGRKAEDENISETPFPPIIVAPPSPIPSPLFSLPSIDSWAFSYTVATVFVGLLLLGAWAYKITHNNKIAVDSRRLTAPGETAPDRPEMEFVGRITGISGAKWSADPKYLPPMGFAHVPLGRKYILESGLMEISYDSGAKVILQGPCTYEVDSSAGGFLALGKLTARVETMGSGVRDQGAEKANPQISKSPNPFVVRTPTAVVTDLGTEFGVEVSKEGNTTSHVFRGSVQVKILPFPASGRGAGGEGGVLQLAAGETALVKKDEADAVRFTHPTTPPKFIRKIYEPPKVLDLLDIVAGGDGTGNRRQRGIDPSTGNRKPEYVSEYCVAYRRYRTALWHNMIDGVFVPDGRAGAVQLDSAGHAFDGFPETAGGTWGSLWARAAEAKPEERVKGWIFDLGPDKQFMPDGRGVLGCHANAGATFDLEAMRAMHSGVRPGRFRAVAGLADTRVTRSWVPEAGDGMADLWIFVDGRLMFNRMKLRPTDGTLNLDVELGPSDRFLTLAVTDGGNGINMDWFVFGDPVLTMVSTESENSASNKRRAGQ